MSDFLFNQGLGRGVEFATRVEANDPTDSALVISAWNTSATDATLKDLDTLAAVEADVNTAEVTNTNYARKVLGDGAGITVTVDDANDRTDVDVPDQTWTAVAAGDAWTDLAFAYDSDTEAGTDANIVPLTFHDFSLTPDGSDITAQIAVGGFLRAS